MCLLVNIVMFLLYLKIFVSGKFMLSNVSCEYFMRTFSVSFDEMKMNIRLRIFCL